MTMSPVAAQQPATGLNAQQGTVVVDTIASVPGSMYVLPDVAARTGADRRPRSARCYATTSSAS